MFPVLPFETTKRGFIFHRSLRHTYHQLTTHHGSFFILYTLKIYLMTNSCTLNVCFSVQAIKKWLTIEIVYSNTLV